MHLAQLNVGRLLAPPDDPEVAEFIGSLDLINGIGKRSKGFVWMMEGSGEPNTGNIENSIGDDPQFVANLTVWEDVQSLEHFVFNTLHHKFFARRHNWFEVAVGPQLVFWRVGIGHRPDLDEGLERLAHLTENGPSDYAFDWEYVSASGLYRERGRTATSA